MKYQYRIVLPMIWLWLQTGLMVPGRRRGERMPIYIGAIMKAFQATSVRWQQGGDNWFDVELNFPQGIVQIAAEVVLDPGSGTLALFDIAIYAKDEKNFCIGSAGSALREAMTDLKRVAQGQGYFIVNITGQRVEHSSSARPGHDVDIRL
ncbi:hypothetical protein ACL9RI_11015 [Janthinobacterium sp. Mn2066]|uniref:hypothetical protein n=1 Tax=Janthinobacterium sp. Mn2066 TaxID=3395264 RepID=UPI003BDA93BE